MNWKIVFIFLAAIFFLLDGFKVQSERFNWTPLGFCSLTIALLLL